MTEPDLVEVRTSSIHGQGLFAKQALLKGQVVAVAIVPSFLPVVGRVTYEGSKINHRQADPSVELMYSYHDKRYHLVTRREVQAGEELLMDYNKTPWFI